MDKALVFNREKYDYDILSKYRFKKIPEGYYRRYNKDKTGCIEINPFNNGILLITNESVFSPALLKVFYDLVKEEIIIYGDLL